MRTLLAVSLLSLTTLATGCKDKPTRKAPPADVTAPATGSAAGSGSSSGRRPAPDLILPRADGTPPKKTVKPHVKEDYEKLAKLEYPGFTADVRAVGDKVFEVRQKTKDFPRLWATVTIQHCLDCLPMELDKWKAKEQDLRVIMGALKDVTEGVETELGTTELNGQPLIYFHFVGMGQVRKDEGGGEMAFGNAYVVYYNDGVNQIRVVAEYKDDPTSPAKMKERAPKADLRALALSFLDVYTHAW